MRAYVACETDGAGASRTRARWPSRSSGAERGLEVARESDWQENAGGNREASQEVARPAAS